jgi:LytS/YehU family sensor histidine kinase
MKGTIVATYSDILSNNYYSTFPLYPYSRYISESLKKGYYYIQDLSTSEDVLLREVHHNANVKTVIYIPIRKQHNLVGFLTINYQDVRELTKKEIDDMIRFTDLIESHIL